MLPRVFHGQRAERSPQIRETNSSVNGGFSASELLEMTLTWRGGRPIPIRLREMALHHQPACLDDRRRFSRIIHDDDAMTIKTRRC